MYALACTSCQGLGASSACPGAVVAPSDAVTFPRWVVVAALLAMVVMAANTNKRGS